MRTEISSVAPPKNLHLQVPADPLLPDRIRRQKPQSDFRFFGLSIISIPGFSKLRLPPRRIEKTLYDFGKNFKKLNMTFGAAAKACSTTGEKKDSPICLSESVRTKCFAPANDPGAVRARMDPGGPEGTGSARPCGRV